MTARDVENSTYWAAIARPYRRASRRLRGLIRVIRVICGYALINGAKRFSTQPEPRVHRRNLLGLLEESILRVAGLANLFPVTLRHGRQWLGGYGEARRCPAGAR